MLVTESLSLREVGRNSVRGNVETLIIPDESGKLTNSSQDSSMRGYVEKKMTKTCKKCGMIFVSLSKHTKVYCSDSCRKNKNYPGSYMGEV